MTIPEIKLTSEEMNDAVHQWLKARGVAVPVEAVATNYSGGGGKWRITLADPDEPPAAPAMPEPGPALPKAEVAS